MIDLSNWLTQLPAWLLSLWHGLGKFFQGVLWFLGASEREKISTAVWQNADGTIAKIITTTDTIPAKTVWDFLALVGVPVTLAVLTFVFQSRQKEREEKREEAEKARQDERLREEGNEKALEDYLNQVSTLLIQNNLIQLAQDSPNSPTLETAKGVIRARTLSLLQRLTDDPTRKSNVIWFLIESKILERLRLSLKETDLSKANLIGASLNKVNLHNAKLSEAIFCNASLNGADLSSANLSKANLFYAKLCGTNLVDADIREATLRHADFSGADLSRAALDEATIIEANFTKSKLINAYLTSAQLIKANLTEADLTSADLEEANLSKADLSKANLSGANLNRAILNDATLSGADLSGAYLRGANLTGAKLSECDFVDLIGAQFQDTIMPDGMARSGKEAERYVEALVANNSTEPG